MKRKQIIACLLSLSLIAPSGLVGVCADTITPITSKEVVAQAPVAKSVDLTGTEYAKATTFTFADTGITVANQGEQITHTITGTQLEITGAGTYILTGSCSDGSITVAKGAGTVNLVFNGLDLKAATLNTTAVSLKKDSEVTIISAKDSVSILTQNDMSGGKPKSVVNASTSLTFGGTGSIHVFGKNKNGIKADDTLTVNSGNIIVDAVDNGISADNAVFIKGGKVYVTSVGNGICSTPDLFAETTKGNVTVTGGDVKIQSQNDGIQGDGTVSIQGGNFYIKADGDGVCSKPLQVSAKDQGAVSITGGTFEIVSGTDGIQADGDLSVTNGNIDIITNGGSGVPVKVDEIEGKISSKGLKADGDLSISGGQVVVDCSDDAINAGKNLTLTKGTFSLLSGEEAMQADEDLTIGTKEITKEDLTFEIKSKNGLEGKNILMHQGKLSLKTTNDGFKSEAPKGSVVVDGYSFTMHDGSINLSAEGDGFDIERDITIHNGQVQVQSKKTPFKSKNNFDLVGGEVVASGAKDKAKLPSEGGQVYASSETNVTAGNTYKLVDSDHKEIYVSKALDFDSSFLFYSSNLLTKDKVYQFTTDELAPPAKEGWTSEEGSWYYYKEGKKQTKWLKDAGVWYFLGDNGVMRTGWFQAGSEWYYSNGSGAMMTGWQVSGNTWYYLGGNGVMRTGWFQDGNTWYYSDASGAMVTGWNVIGGAWYFLGNNGVMRTGWFQDGGNWYFTDANGAMKTGWFQNASTWYFTNPSGAMVTGWLQQGQTWYYLLGNGAMVTGRHLVDGRWSNFTGSGVWLGYL